MGRRYAQDEPLAVARLVPELVASLPGVVAVELCGSRLRGDAGRYSDWDFSVRTEDFDATATALPEAFEAVDPLAAQWDRLSDWPCFMVIVAGPTKIDLLFQDLEHALEGPWAVSGSTLRGIDDHFWDWMLWLASKADAGKSGLVGLELEKMHEHLLAPLGVDPPSSLRDAVDEYLAARRRWEARLDTHVNRRLGDAVIPVIDRVIADRRVPGLPSRQGPTVYPVEGRERGGQ